MVFGTTGDCSIQSAPAKFKQRPVAQLVNALDSESRDCQFDSDRAGQLMSQQRVNTLLAANLPKSSTLRAYHCKYDWHGGWGAYQTYDLIVVAESREKALEACMSYGSFNSTRDARYWEINEIPMHKPETIYVSESSC